MGQVFCPSGGSGSLFVGRLAFLVCIIDVLEEVFGDHFELFICKRQYKRACRVHSASLVLLMP